MPKEELRPGMTSEVKIMVGEVPNVLLAPVQAVAQHKGKFYAYVVTPQGVARREVKVGDTNEFQVQIVEGLNEGDSVSLDARTRVSAEFKDDDKEQDQAKKTAPPSASPPPGG